MCSGVPCRVSGLRKSPTEANCLANLLRPSFGANSLAHEADIPPGAAASSHLVMFLYVFGMHNEWCVRDCNCSFVCAMHVLHAVDSGNSVYHHLHALPAT